MFKRILLVAASALITSGCQRQEVATVVRDNYGVPHVFANSEVAAAYAFGYVQAEDRIGQLMQWYRWAEGRLSEAFGPAFVETDFEQKLWRHAEIAQTGYPQLPRYLQRILDAFAAGINDYVRQHPERVPAWAVKVEPWHPLALGRAFIWDWPLDDAKDDLRRGLQQPEASHGRGSNQWVVAPARSATGTAIALIDPHLSWEESGHWYEARIHAGRWQACGMVVVGTPFVGLGHTEAVCWAATTGGPDCGDCYRILLDDPEKPTRYRYDGAWRPLQVDTVAISVLRSDRVDTIRRVVFWTHHGPIYERRGTVAYALALPYLPSVRLIEQLYRMNRARSLAEFQEAMAMCEFMPQNIMAADVDGNIWYVRTGKVPIREAKYDWSYPVPGDTSATEWRGIHRQDDLVQILNPKCGYMQNCNISPGTMMAEGAPRARDYLPYIYNDREDRSNPRGRRALEVLSSIQKMTREDAFALAFDTKIPGVQAWQDALREAFREWGEERPSLSRAVETLVSWNGRLGKEEAGALLYYRWRQELGRIDPELRGELPPNPEPSRSQALEMFEALVRASESLRQVFGKEHVPWGEFLRLQRGDSSWALDGGSFEYGLSALRAVWGRAEAGRVRASGGQSCPMLVFLGRPIESYSVLPWGISDDPKSPHFADQAPLFARCQMKPTWFHPDSLRKHTESRVELRFRAE